MKTNILLLFVFLEQFCLTQTFKIIPVYYSVNALFDRRNGANFQCDDQGRFQNELIFYSMNKKDTVIRFKSAVYNNCLKGVSEWYNHEGKLMQQVINNEGSCTVHASIHSFEMMESYQLKLSALIGKSTFWDNSPTYHKKMEEFYTDGLLTKRIYFFQNEMPFKIVHYALKSNYFAPSYADEYNKYEESGEFTQYNTNGTIAIHGEKKANKYVGTWSYYSENGTLETEKKFLNLDSVIITNYYPTGTKKSLETQWHFAKIGDYFTFYETGELATKTTYSDNGIQKGPSYTYFPSGKLMEEIPCCIYYKNGNYTKWFENGQIEEKSTFTEGLNTGKYFTWYSNGQLKTKGQFNENGNETGKWYTYNEKGKLLSVKDYDKEIREVSATEMTETAYEVADYPADHVHYDFSLRITSSYIFGKSTSIKGDLRFLKKYSHIDIIAKLDEKGKPNFEILTPLSANQTKKLLFFLQENVIFNGGFKIGYSYVPCSVQMRIDCEK